MLARIQGRLEADSRVADQGSRAARLEDVTCQEILSLLRLRRMLNFDRICRDLALNRKAAWGYVTFLMTHRLALRHRSRETGVWRVEIAVEAANER